MPIHNRLVQADGSPHRLGFLGPVPARAEDNVRAMPFADYFAGAISVRRKRRHFTGTSLV